jgi:hypothetical protein
VTPIGRLHRDGHEQDDSLLRPRAKTRFAIGKRGTCSARSLRYVTPI